MGSEDHNTSEKLVFKDAFSNDLEFVKAGLGVLIRLVSHKQDWHFREIRL